MTSIHGFHWEFAGGTSDAAFGDLLDAFPRLEPLAGVRTLKENRMRTVYHVPAVHLGDPDIAPGGVLVKVYRYPKAWDRFRYRFLDSRAEQEWRALHRFAELEIPTASPLGVAQQRLGSKRIGGGLIATFLEGTETVSDRLYRWTGGAHGDAALAPDAVRLIQRLGRRIHDLQSRGVWHRDLHAGNFLIHEETDEIFIVDLHTCRFRRRLADWQRRQGIVKMAHSLGTIVPSAGVDLFLEAALGEGFSDGALPRLHHAVRRLEARRLRSRSQRCFVPSSAFAVSRSTSAGRDEPVNVRDWYRRDWGDGAEAVCEDVQALCRTEPPGEIIQRSQRGWVAAARTPEGRRVCVKYRRLGWRESLLGAFGGHGLRRAYGAGHALVVHGVRTPEVLALRERVRLRFLPREAWLVTVLLDDATSLDVHLLRTYGNGSAEVGEPARRKHAFARTVGRFVASVHRYGFYPHDFSPQNIVVTSDGLYLVDLDDLRLRRRLTARRRQKNLVQVGNLPEGHISVADRLRALAAYAASCAEGVYPWGRSASSNVTTASSRYGGREFIAGLRRGLLVEHEKVLHDRLRRESVDRARVRGASTS